MLAERGIPTLGIDITEHALVHARARGVPVLARCVCLVPSLAADGCAAHCFLEGNLGIGGTQYSCCAVSASSSPPDGAFLVEVEPPGHLTRPRFGALQKSPARGTSGRA